MTADIDQLTREALDAMPLGEGSMPFAVARHAIRFTLSRYAPHELPDPAAEFATRLESEWIDYSGMECKTAFIIRRTREEDAKSKPQPEPLPAYPQWAVGTMTDGSLTTFILEQALGDGFEGRVDPPTTGVLCKDGYIGRGSIISYHATRQAAQRAKVAK